MTNQLKGYWKQAKNTVLQIPEIEKKVKEATSNENWGPSSTLMREIARATYNSQDFPLIMAVIFKRLNDHGKYWRHVYKSLLLIDYLLRHGSERMIQECRNRIYEVNTLQEFQFIDENDKDHGLSVRERAKLVCELINDDQRLRTEREKAKENLKKFDVGIGSEGLSAPGGWSDYPSNSSSSYNSTRRQEEEENEEEEESEEEERVQTRSAPRSEGSSSTGRVRAPSGGGGSPPPAVAKELFSFDEPAPRSAPSKNVEFDFFSGPNASSSGFPSSAAPVTFSANTTEFFGASSDPFAFKGSAPAPVDPFKSAPVNTGFFDPRDAPSSSLSAPPTGQGSEWAQFDSFNPGSQAPKTEKPKEENDPWAAKHLFDLSSVGSNPASKPPALGPSSSTSAMKPISSIPVMTGGMSTSGLGMTPATPVTQMKPNYNIGPVVPGVGAPMGYGMGGPSMGMGMNPSMGMGMNPSMGMGMNPSMGMNPPMGMGMNPSMGMGMNPSMGMGMNPSMGMGMGMNPSMGMGMGMNPAMGMGRGGPNPSMGMGMNPTMGMGTQPKW